MAKQFPQVTIPDTEIRRLPSSQTGYEYNLHIALPAEYADTNKTYPTLYSLDPHLTIARRTWRYFDTFMGAEDHGLPADNLQETPGPTVAHRTSPTNIGLGLLSTLAAHDFGYIRTPELLDRIDLTMTTLEGL